MAIYKCLVCETVYDEEKEGKRWEQVADDWLCHVCESGKCPMGIATQDPALRARFSVDESSRRLLNFLKVSSEELKDFARLTGNDDVHKLAVSDLCTTNSEISNHTAIEHV